MKVTQIAEILNSIYTELTGKDGIVKEDLSNIVDTGKEVLDANNVDNYVKKLVDRIGKVVFVDRKYSGAVPSIVRDAWEYGSVMQKIDVETPAAVDDNRWKLVDGESYPTDVFHAPKVTSRFYNSKNSFSIEMSFLTDQLKESFISAAHMNAFLSAILTAIENSMTIKLDSMVSRALASMIADTFHSAFADGTGYANAGNVKCVNLLKLYNTKFGTELTKDKALISPEFIRFASFMVGVYADRMTNVSTLFNIGGRERFTAREDLQIVALSDFQKSAAVYLYSDSIHDNYVKLPEMQTVPYWQGSGTTYDFNTISGVNVVSGNGNTFDGITAGVNVLAVMFDKNAVGLSNLERKTTSAYNANGDFYNNYYKGACSWFTDANENFVVFYIA